MALDPQRMMAQLNPMSAIDIGGFGQAASQRQQMKLMREKFEEEKRRNREDERLRRISEAGEMRRAEMAGERQKAQAEAAAAEKRRAEAATAYGDFYKARDVNDFAGMSAAGERLREFGGLADNLGTDEQGRPSYRIGMDAQAYREQEAQRDAQAAPGRLEAPEGSVWLPPGLGEESLPQSLNRLSALGYDRTQEGVTDQGAFMDQRNAQAGPMLESLRAGLPEGAYRDSRGATNEAVLQLGLSPKDSAEMQLKLQAPADAAIGKALDAENDFKKEERAAERAYDKEMRSAKTEAEKQAIALAKDGRANAAKQWKDTGLYKVLDAEKAANQITAMLSSDNKLDANNAAHMFLTLKGSLGAQSNAEMDEVFGTKMMSTPEAWLEAARKFFEGGVAPEIKKSILGIVERGLAENDRKIYSFLDSMEETLESPETTEEAKRGWRQFRDSVPKKYRDQWDEDRKADGLPTFDEMEEDRKPLDEPMKGTKTGLHEGIRADADFMDTFANAAIDAGLDPEKILPLINYESGGNAQAANTRVSSEGVGSSAKGLIQFLDSTAQEYGFKDAAEFSALSAAEQAPYVIQYLVDKGITAASSIGDMYVAIAAPALVSKGDDAVAYRKDADTKKGRAEYELNTDWDLDKDGKVTRGELSKLGESKGGRAKAAERQAEADAKPAKKPGPNDHELDSLLE